MYFPNKIMLHVTRSKRNEIRLLNWLGFNQTFVDITEKEGLKTKMQFKRKITANNIRMK